MENGYILVFPPMHAYAWSPERLDNVHMWRLTPRMCRKAAVESRLREIPRFADTAVEDSTHFLYHLFFLGPNKNTIHRAKIERKD